jgi:hypothetical protein
MPKHNAKSANTQLEGREMTEESRLRLFATIDTLGLEYDDDPAEIERGLLEGSKTNTELRNAV